MTLDLKKLFGANTALDKKFVDVLLKAIKDGYIKEFDYLKFKKSVQTLGQMDMDEETSYKSAFATASTIGLNKEKLLKTANHYLSLLEKERNHFADALKNQRSERISGRISAIDEMKLKIESNKQKIASLEKENAVFQSKIDGADGVIQKEKDKIEDIKNKFVKAYDYLEDIINKDIEKIDKYI